MAFNAGYNRTSCYCQAWKSLILNSIYPSENWALDTEVGAERGRFADEHSHSFSECFSSIESGLRWPCSTERPGWGKGGEASAERNITLVLKQHREVAHINGTEAERTKNRLANVVQREHTWLNQVGVWLPLCALLFNYGGRHSNCQMCRYCHL